MSDILSCVQIPLINESQSLASLVNYARPTAVHASTDTTDYVYWAGKKKGMAKQQSHSDGRNSYSLKPLFYQYKSTEIDIFLHSNILYI